jgi:hypothetical protein
MSARFLRTGQALSRLVTTALVMAAMLVGIGQLPAAAAGGSASVVFGSGTISPGLAAVPTDQTWTFTTANMFGLPTPMMAASGGGAAAVYINCAFSGSSSLPETVSTGEGTGSGFCTTCLTNDRWCLMCLAGPVCLSETGVGAVTKSCSLFYFRVGSILAVVLHCAVTVNNGPWESDVEVGTCNFIPLNWLPTTAYTTECAFGAADPPSTSEYALNS